MASRALLGMVIGLLVGCAAEDEPRPAGEWTPAIKAADADGDGELDTTDCDDGDPAVHTGASETCDATDEDCDGIVDDGACPCTDDTDGDHAFLFCTTRATWTLRPSEDAARVRSLDEACERVEALLRRAVREHLESDVPIATFLSDGIDSSLITALALEESSSPIRSYSIGFREPRFDESPHARETARILGVENRVAIVDEAVALEKLADVLIAYDEPFGD